MIMETELLTYLQSLRLRVRLTTYKRKAWQIGSFFTWLAKQGKHWQGVKRDDIDIFLSSFVCCRAVRRQLAQVVRDFYQFHKINYNPAEGIVFKRDNTIRLPRVPSQGIVDALITKLQGKDDVLSVRNRLLAELAYGSGLRRDELRKVNIEDIDLDGHTLRVHGKGARVRIVPITNSALQTIRVYLQLRSGAGRGPLLVTFTGRRLSLQSVYHILKEQGGIRPHLLRHACATHMLENGASIRMVQELLGHKDLKATAIYTHISKENLREVINQKHPRAKL